MSDGPKEHPTMQMPKVTVPTSQIDAVLAEVRAMRSDSARVEAKVDIAIEEGKTSNLRLSSLEQRVAVVERRQDDGSIRVRATSETNLKQDAVIADVLERVTKLDAGLAVVATKTDAQTAILTDIRDGAAKLAKNPLIVGLLSAAAAALTSWLAARGH